MKKNQYGRNYIITNQFLNAPNTHISQSVVTASVGVHEKTDMNILRFSLSIKLCTFNIKISTHTFKKPLNYT